MTARSPWKFSSLKLTLKLSQSVPSRSSNFCLLRWGGGWSITRFQHRHRLKVGFKMEFDPTRTIASPLQVRDASRCYKLESSEECSHASRSILACAVTLSQKWLIRSRISPITWEQVAAKSEWPARSRNSLRASTISTKTTDRKGPRTQWFSPRTA